MNNTNFNVTRRQTTSTDNNSPRLRTSTEFCRAMKLKKEWFIKAIHDAGFLNENSEPTELGEKYSFKVTHCVINHRDCLVIGFSEAVVTHQGFIDAYKAYVDASLQALHEKAARMGGYSLSGACRLLGLDRNVMRDALRREGYISAEDGTLLAMGIENGAHVASCENDDGTGISSYNVYPLELFNNMSLRKAYEDIATAS